VIEALAIIGGGTTLTLIGLVAYVTYRMVGAFRDLNAARDLLDAARVQTEATDERADNAEQEVANLTARLVAGQEAFKTEHALRLDVEKQRDRAIHTARDHLVERLRKSNVADANHLLSDLLGMRIDAVPAEGRATAPGPDSLIDPFATVQPPKSP